MNGPVFVHAWFRSGSTWFWSKLRQDQRLCAYYEPLNEELAIWKPERIRQGPTRAFEGDNHPPLGHHYFFEYLDLMERGQMKFSPALSYERYVLGPDEHDAALEAYLTSLVEDAASRGLVAALCFCRSQMRSLWMRRRLGGLHISQLRGAVGQWASFGKHPYFVQRMLLTAFLLHRRHEASLSFVPGFDTMYKDWKTGRRISYSEEAGIGVFAALWLASALQAVAAGDVVLDLDRLGSDPALRAETADLLRGMGLPHDLDDCRPPPVHQDAGRRLVMEGALALSARWIATNPNWPLLPSGSIRVDAAARLDQLSEDSRAHLAAALD